MELIEDEHYWRIDDIIIIKSHIVNSFDTNFLIRLNINTLIFSNSLELVWCINYDNKFGQCSSFNDLITIPDCIEYLNFGYNFNQIIFLPDSIKKLVFGTSFDKSIELPRFLQTLSFGNNFNQIISFPDSIKYLIFGNNFNQIVTFPNELIQLIFGNNFNQNIILPYSLEYLHFGNDFNQIIILPDSLKHLIFGNKFNQNISYPPSLVNLQFGTEFNNFAELINIKELTINNWNTRLMNNLPNSLELLIFSSGFNRNKICEHIEFYNLPTSVKKIEFLNTRFSYGFNLIQMPDSIETIMLPNDFVGRIIPLPKNLKKIICNKRYKYLTDFSGIIVEHL